MKTETIMRIVSMAVVVLMAADTFAQKPKWIGNTPKELNYTYKFVEVVSSGSTLEAARTNAKDMLADDTQLQEGIRIYRRTQQHTTIDKVRENAERLQETKRDHITVDVTVDGENFDLQASRVDEYAEYGGGIYTVHTLYMVALCDNPVFDRTYLTTSYGAAPVAMSIIPGLGQWYKGSKTKGICMFAAEAAAVAGVIVCDNQRASYKKKMGEQPKFSQTYNTKADNWETGRNVCIGIAAGIWIYNIVDAAVAKGARRVVVKRADGGGLSVAPLTLPYGAGVSLAYRF